MSIDLLVQIAEKEVGVMEDPNTNNIGLKIQIYQKTTWLVPGAWAWCAAFCCWVLNEWLKDPVVQRALNLKTQSDIDKWRCRDASAFGWEKWAKNKGLLILNEKQLAKKGDFVIFDFSHIGIVTEDQKTIKTSIKTIEGNTNGKGERDSISGDGVWRKSRNPTLTKSYVRIL